MKILVDKKHIKNNSVFGVRIFLLKIWIHQGQFFTLQPLGRHPPGEFKACVVVQGMRRLPRPWEPGSGETCAQPGGGHLETNQMNLRWTMATLPETNIAPVEFQLSIFRGELLVSGSVQCTLLGINIPYQPALLSR